MYILIHCAPKYFHHSNRWHCGLLSQRYCNVSIYLVQTLHCNVSAISAFINYPFWVETLQCNVCTMHIDQHIHLFGTDVALQRLCNQRIHQLSVLSGDVAVQRLYILRIDQHIHLFGTDVALQRLCNLQPNLFPPKNKKTHLM